MFILVNVLDIFMTRLLLAYGAIEANPIANFFLRFLGFNGMIVFKLLIVSFVCLIAQVVATKRKATGRGLLIAGTLLVAAVVAYSVWLYLNKIAR
jgi:amino acid permease